MWGCFFWQPFYVKGLIHLKAQLAHGCLRHGDSHRREVTVYRGMLSINLCKGLLTRTVVMSTM